MKMRHWIIFSLLLSFSIPVYSQKTEIIKSLLQKYFISLPFDKQITDFIQELANSDKISVDTTHKKDSADKIFLRGYITNWSVLANLDSIKVFLGRMYQSSTLKVNGMLTSKSVDSFLYLREIFYFPTNGMDDKEWKAVSKSVLKEFRNSMVAVYPSSISNSQGEVVWFTPAHELPAMPLITMEYGKIEKRSLYFIILTLNFKTEPSE